MADRRACAADLTEAFVPTPLGDVALRLRGDGPVVVLCLHGIGSSSASFGRMTAVAPASWRIGSWDAPGYGRSADPTVMPTMGEYAAAAAVVADEVGGPVVAVGVSWGGVIATRLALERPDVVAALVLVSSSVGSGAEPERAAAMRARAEELESVGPRAFAEARGPKLLSAAAPDSLRRDVIEIMATDVRLPGYAGAAASMAATDHRARLSEISAPTLVLAGGGDDVTGPADASLLAAGINGAVMAVLPGAGHLLPQEEPTFVVQEIQRLLDRSDNPGGPSR
jgi:pimeloyl-ACP methyl ester carboxylesterase